LRRNEVGTKISAQTARQAMNGKAKGPLGLFIEEERQQRAATILRDAAYIIEARFEMLGGTDPVAKHYNMFKRRAEQGQYFHHPYFGTREFPCDFEWIDGPLPESELAGERDLGWMLHDIDFADNRNPRFFHAIMRNGVIAVPPFANAEAAP
jgi:CRISPR-associated protein Cas5d